MLQSTYKIFFLLLFFQYIALFSSFLLFFCSFRVGPFLFLLLVCSYFSFYFFQFQHFSLSLLVDVVLGCLKLSFYGNQVRSESLKKSAGTCAKSELCYTVICMFIPQHNHTIIKTHEDFFTNMFSLSLYL